MLERRWSPGRALEFSAVVRPLRRGPGDPAFQVDARGTWLAGNTVAGPGTLCVRVAGGEVLAAGWGPGADVLLDGLPALLGAEDDDSDFTAHHPVVAEVRRRRPGLRLGSTGRVWDVLLAAVLEQKVTGTEAHRSWRELARRFGVAAPGPAPDGMRVPPTAAAVLGIPSWEWHKAGVDHARRRAIIGAAQVAGRLEGAAQLRGVAGRELLRKVPGVGVWTAAEVAQRAWGDPDAVSIGDFHLAGLVGYALTGAVFDDAAMIAALGPYAPQRHRAAVYILAAGLGKPRKAPRFSPRDYRRM
ncbi:DNA-3-methyladenine glycosylase family protein [Actinokineospora guangxiensis]|uniref:DNA-3-methyladenine glycosylase family protein n=1 Tax=Actinokineospora guangxiensis TaxID=1490288 RepID=A0ABW0EVU8_9PSEU